MLSDERSINEFTARLSAYVSNVGTNTESLREFIEQELTINPGIVKVLTALSRNIGLARSLDRCRQLRIDLHGRIYPASQDLEGIRSAKT